MSKPSKYRRILYAFPSFNLGGAEKRAVSIMNADRSGREHIVVSLDGQMGAASYVSPKINFKCIPFKTKVNSLLRIWQYRAFIKEISPDLLVTQNWGSILWHIAKIGLHIRHVHLEDGFGPDEAERFLKRRIWFRRFCFVFCDAVIVPSFKLKLIAETLWKLPKRKLYFIPNGIECGLYLKKSKKVPIVFKKNNKKIKLGTIARLRPEKNLYRMIDAFELVLRQEKNIVLYVMGSGNLETDLKVYAKSRKLERFIVFTGNIDKPQDYIPFLDIFLLSSDTEQMPYSVIEAMACALPVVSVDVGDVRQMVGKKNQEFICSKNASEMSEFILMLLRDEQKRFQLGHENQLKAQNEFSFKVMLEKHLACYYTE